MSNRVERIIGIVTATHGYQTVRVDPSLTFDELLRKLQQNYSQSLENYCFIRKQQQQEQLQLIEIDNNTIVGDYSALYSQEVYLVPKQLHIEIKTPLNIINKEEKIEITLKSTEYTLPSLKNLIGEKLHILPKFQLIICNGKVYNNENQIILLPVCNQNSSIQIKVLVDEKYQSFQPKAKYKCPISGYLINQPVVANRINYSKLVLDDWTSGHQVRYCPFNIAIKIYSTNEINQPFKEEINQYLSNVNVHDRNISTLNDLGESFAILETVKEYLNGTPLFDLNLPFIPAIVFLGDESVGKSSLLTRLTMLSFFPVGMNRTTTIVTIIKFRRSPAKAPKYQVYHGGGDQISKKIAAAVGHGILTVEMGPELSRNSHIEIEIFHPCAPNLDLYDCPGFTSVRDDRPVRDFLDDHIRVNNDRSMYVYSIGASDEYRDPTYTARTRMYEIFEEHPELLDRTVVAFTQTDRANPERLNELLNYPVSHENITGLNFKWGHVLTAAHCGGFENFDNEAGGNLFSSFENRVYLENGFFNDIPFHGCNELISRLQSIEYYLLKNYFETSQITLEQNREELRQQYNLLGLPVAHEYNRYEDKKPIFIEFVNQAVNLLLQGFNTIKINFEAEYLTDLKNELSNIFHDVTFSSRIEIDIYLEEIKETILNLSHAYYERELDFWLTQIYQTLSTQDTIFKMRRFQLEINKIGKYVQDIVHQHHQNINNKLERFLDLHFDNFSGLIRINSQNALGTPSEIFLEFDPELCELLVHIFSSTLSCFRDPSNIFSHDNLNRILESSPFIESNREERYNLLQNITLIDITLNKLSIILADAEYRINNPIPNINTNEDDEDESDDEEEEDDDDDGSEDDDDDDENDESEGVIGEKGDGDECYN